MNCQAANNLLQDFIDGRLTGPESELISVHLKRCSACSVKYQDSLAVVELLKEVRVPPAFPDFPARALKLATNSTVPAANKRLPYVAGSIAVSVIVLFILLSVMINPVPDDSRTPIVLIGDEVRTIKVAIESAHAVDSIKMTIVLTDNLEISGYQNQKNISWNTRLEKGTNIIALPVSAIAQGNGEITTRVGLRDREKVFKIKTRYQSPDKARHEYPGLANA